MGTALLFCSRQRTRTCRAGNQLPGHDGTLRGKKVRAWFGMTECFFTIDFQHFVFMSLSYPAALKDCSVVDFLHPPDLYYYLGGSFTTRADSIDGVINKLREGIRTWWIQVFLANVTQWSMFSFKKLQFINTICLIQYISLKIISIYFVFLKIKSLHSSSSH